MGILSFWDSLEAKYARDLADDDIVDLFTQKIIQDKGVIRSEPEHEIGSFANAISVNNSRADGTNTPISLDISDDEYEAQEEEVDEDDFEGWSNVPDQFGRSRLGSLASSPRKPLFGNLPPITTTTEEEDLAAFMAAEHARRDREGDFDAELDAKLRAEQAARRAIRRVSSISSSAVSLSTLPTDDQDSDDELNLGYTPSPSKLTASAVRPSFRQLHQESDVESDGLGVGYVSQEEDIDPLNLFDVRTRALADKPDIEDNGDDQTSDDEMLIGPPVSLPRKKTPPEPVKVLDLAQESEDETGAQDDATDSDIDPIDAFSPPPRSPRPEHKYVTPLSPLRYAPQPKPSLSVPKPQPLPAPQHLWTPPLSTSSIEPYERNPGVKSWLASATRIAPSPEKPRSDFRHHLASPPLSSASLSSSSAGPSSYFAPHPPASPNANRKQTFERKTFALPTPSVEPSDVSRPSSLRQRTPSPEKKQRVLQFDPIPRYDSDEFHSSHRSRLLAPSRSPSPLSAAEQPDTPPSRQRPALLRKRKRDSTPETQEQRYAPRDDTAHSSEFDEEDQYESEMSSARSIDQVSDSDPSDQEEDGVDRSPPHQTGRRNSGRHTVSRAPPSKHPPQVAHVSTTPAPAPPIPHHLPPQPLPPAYPTYGYSQVGQCPDPAVLSHVIHSLNYLAFNGFNAPAPPRTPPIAPQPLFAQQCSPSPHSLMHVPHSMPHTPYYPYPAHPYSVPNSTPPHLPWSETFPTSTESAAQVGSVEQPRTPRRSRRGSHSPKTNTKRPGAVSETDDTPSSLPAEGRSRRRHESRRHSSLSPRKSARSTERSTPSARSRSRASASSGPSDEPSTSSPTRTEFTRTNVGHDLPPFATPKRERVRNASRPGPFTTPRRSTQEVERATFRTPRNPNPSPLRRSITASDLFGDFDEDGKSRSHASKSRDLDFHSPSRNLTNQYSRRRCTPRPGPSAMKAKSPMSVAIELIEPVTPTNRRFRV